MITNTIILFNVNIFKRPQVEELCKDMGIHTVTATSADWYRTIDSIAENDSKDISSDRGKNQPSINEDMLIFCGLMPDKFDRFLELYKEREIMPVSLKAVMTPFNAKWTALRLCTELKKEKVMIDLQNKKHN